LTAAGLLFSPAPVTAARNPILGIFVVCCAAAGALNAKIKAQAVQRKALLRASLRIENPKPVLSQVEVSKIQNRII
jgi:hypothetical protein